MRLAMIWMAFLFFTAPALAQLPSAAESWRRLWSEPASFTFAEAGVMPKSPRTLLKWEVGTDAENGEEDQGEIEFQADRPDFTEASRTVGRGRVQIETGYTFTRDRRDGVTTRSSSFPEALFRIGMFADWFEFRFQQNFASLSRSGPTGERFTASGAEDLYLGVKLWLVEQRGIFPEVAIQLQGTVPTGSRDFTANQVLPGINLLYGWDIIKDAWTAGGSLVVSRAVDETGHTYLELATSFTFGFDLTAKLGAYTEWYVIAPSGAVQPGLTAQHYFNGGFTYKVTPDFQLDIRAGVGLSRQADDFFMGAGLVYRF